MGVFHAMDNLRSSRDFMGLGDGQLVHARGIHPHFAGAGCDRIADSRDSGTKARVEVGALRPS